MTSPSPRLPQPSTRAVWAVEQVTSITQLSPLFWDAGSGDQPPHFYTLLTPCLHTLPTPSNFKPSRCKREREKYWSYQKRMSSSILMSSLSRQKYASCSGARGGGWCHYSLPGCELGSPVTRSALTGGQWVPGKLNKHRPPSYFWSAARAGMVFTGYLSWLRGTVNVLRSHGIKQ